TVRAAIHAGMIIIGGTVHGNITAEKKVELQTSARLYGNISTPSLSIAEGVVFEGSCTMGKKNEKGRGRVESPPAAQPQEKILSK
ncbi:polymer-forming cytoskeletal protein, partial [Candidatus Moduliflexota bacterium]